MTYLHQKSKKTNTRRDFRVPKRTKKAPQVSLFLKQVANQVNLMKN